MSCQRTLTSRLSGPWPRVRRQGMAYLFSERQIRQPARPPRRRDAGAVSAQMEGCRLEVLLDLRPAMAPSSVGPLDPTEPLGWRAVAGCCRTALDDSSRASVRGRRGTSRRVDPPVPVDTWRWSGAAQQACPAPHDSHARPVLGRAGHDRRRSGHLLDRSVLANGHFSPLRGGRTPRAAGRPAPSASPPSSHRHHLSKEGMCPASWDSRSSRSSTSSGCSTTGDQGPGTGARPRGRQGTQAGSPTPHAAQALGRTEVAAGQRGAHFSELSPKRSGWPDAARPKEKTKAPMPRDGGGMDDM